MVVSIEYDTFLIKKRNNITICRFFLPEMINKVGFLNKKEFYRID